MTTISISGLLQILLLCLHPIHISVTEIEFDPEDKALEIMMRVFVDDLEQAVRSELKQPHLDILEPDNGQTIDQIVENYLSRRFAISLDGKPQKAKYLGHEVESGAFIFYIEVSGVRKWQTIQVKNSIITETYEDQANLVNVTVGEKIRSLRLTRNTPVDRLTFDNS